MANQPMPDGLDTPDLECVMLDLPPQPVRSIMGLSFDEADLFYGDIPRLQYARGAVAEEEAHVTLLFGIHPSETYVDDVLTALGDWTPEDVYIDHVDFFPSRIEGQDYSCIVAKVVPTASLLIARKRLETLPFTDQFNEYKPHVTLAYIKRSDPDKISLWVDTPNTYYKKRILTPTEFNLGLDFEEESQ